MKLLLALLVAVLAALWWRVRRLERRLLDLQDRAVDWRLHLARNYEELAERLEALQARVAPDSRAPARPAAGAESLIQIRSLGRTEK